MMESKAERGEPRDRHETTKATDALLVGDARDVREADEMCAEAFTSAYLEDRVNGIFICVRPLRPENLAA